VSRREDFVAVVEMASVRFGRRDAIASNAGIGPISRLDELRVADWEEMIDVNLKGFLYGISAALPVSGKQGFGHFVNIVSTAGPNDLAHHRGLRRSHERVWTSDRICDRGAA
jgi:NADP-dependent 3-hydroxy acid dehydrogenase YdfG